MHRVGDHVMAVRSCSFGFARQPPGCNVAWSRPVASTVPSEYEQVASLGSVPASPSVADRIALWRRVYETLAQLASRIDADAQGKIISAVHSRIPPRAATAVDLCGLSLNGAVPLRRVFAPAKAAGAVSARTTTVGTRSSVWRMGGPRQGGQRYRKALERSSAVCQRAGASTALGICQVVWPMRADEAR